MKLVRVIAPHFVAGFETDGVVRELTGSDARQFRPGVQAAL